MVRAGNGVYTLATSPYILVGIDLNEEAMPIPDITAFDLCDLQIGGLRQHLGRFIKGVFKA
jgi:hypothetical protein